MSDFGPVVSSSHLADSSLPELSELEFALTLLRNAFDRWIVRGMAAAGLPDLSPLEVQVLHSTHHRDRPKTLADICLMLGIEDTYTVNYAIKKLAKAGLVAPGRMGKEKTVRITETGADVCRRYAKLRERLLLESLADIGLDPELLSRNARLLRSLSGHYDQAARAAVAS